MRLMLKVNWPWAKPKDNYSVAALCIILAELVGITGTVFTLPNIPAWYSTLNKPFFAPPNWLFSPVWTTLYALIGLSAYLIWRRYRFNKKSREYWQYFGAQMILNFIWTPVFFGLKETGLAYAIIVAMAICIYQTIRTGSRLERWAGYILYPYLVWVTFASFLNLSIYILN